MVRSLVLGVVALAVLVTAQSSITPISPTPFLTSTPAPGSTPAPTGTTDVRAETSATGATSASAAETHTIAVGVVSLSCHRRIRHELTSRSPGTRSRLRRRRPRSAIPLSGSSIPTPTLSSAPSSASPVRRTNMWILAAKGSTAALSRSRPSLITSVERRQACLAFQLTRRRCRGIRLSSTTPSRSSSTAAPRGRAIKRK